MKFTFDLTERDYLDFNLFTMENHNIIKKQKKYLRLLFTAIPFLVFLVDWLLKGRFRPVFAEVVCFIAIAIFSILIWFYFPKRYNKIIQKNAEKILFKEGRVNILGKRELFFEEKSIRYVTEYEEGVTKYEMITEMKEADTAIYLYTSPATAIMLPLRAFESEKEKKEFIHFIDTRIKQ